MLHIFHQHPGRQRGWVCSHGDGRLLKGDISPRETPQRMCCDPVAGEGIQGGGEQGLLRAKDSW